VRRRRAGRLLKKRMGGKRTCSAKSNLYRKQTDDQRMGRLDWGSEMLSRALNSSRLR